MNDQRTLVMGILNVTPDSFADGGRHNTFALALARAEEMILEGADIIDIGGESTRPGAERVTADIEKDRTIPLITELQSRGIALSIDTMRAEVAEAAISAGATIVNDVSGGLADPAMAPLIARNKSVQYIAMHWRGHSRDMQSKAEYEDVVREVKNELDERVTSLLDAGIDAEQIVIDPGLGFAKTAEHNWELLRNLDRLSLLGYPILIGASRKRFLGELLEAENPDDRESATIALTTELARQRVWAVRTHAVRAHRDAIAVIEELGK
jgi:dihydropteroate synthase